MRASGDHVEIRRGEAEGGMGGRMCMYVGVGEEEKGAVTGVEEGERQGG